MKEFWVLTYIDENEQIRRQRYDDEETARNSWYRTERALFLDQVVRYETNL